MILKLDEVHYASLPGNTQRSYSQSILNGGEPRWRKGAKKISDLAIETVFFRIDIASMTGLRGIPEAE